jgi:hypothetical protein
VPTMANVDELHGKKKPGIIITVSAKMPQTK